MCYIETSYFIQQQGFNYMLHLGDVIVVVVIPTFI